jgi:hypothetical protein
VLPAGWKVPRAAVAPICLTQADLSHDYQAFLSVTLFLDVVRHGNGGAGWIRLLRWRHVD